MGIPFSKNLYHVKTSKFICFANLVTGFYMMRVFAERYFRTKYLNAEAVAQMCSVKKVFLEISQNSQENTCVRVSILIKLQALGLQLYQNRDSVTVVFL